MQIKELTPAVKALGHNSPVTPNRTACGTNVREIMTIQNTIKNIAEIINACFSLYVMGLPPINT